MPSAVIERSAGINVGKKFRAVCVMTGTAQENATAEVRHDSNGTGTRARVAQKPRLYDVAMESTGCCWKPVLNILEDDPEYRVEVALPMRSRLRDTRPTRMMHAG
jgi:transposase